MPVRCLPRNATCWRNALVEARSGTGGGGWTVWQVARRRMRFFTWHARAAADHQALSRGELPAELL